jgi:hypothetical protein
MNQARRYARAKLLGPDNLLVSTQKSAAFRPRFGGLLTIVQRQMMSEGPRGGS